MKKEESQDDFCGVESCPVLIELAGPLDLEHEVTAVDVLHHKEQPLLVGSEGGGG